jgi:hypothetical protein
MKTALNTHEAASAADRQWFATHEGRSCRMRPPLPGELAALNQTKLEENGWPARIVTKLVKPGYRLRVVIYTNLDTIPSFIDDDYALARLHELIVQRTPSGDPPQPVSAAEFRQYVYGPRQ